MGFLSRDGSVKRRQLSNRVQVAKGVFFTAVSLSLLCYLLSLNCTTNTLLKRAKRSILNPLDETGYNITLLSNSTSEQQFLQKYIDQYKCIDERGDFVCGNCKYKNFYNILRPEGSTDSVEVCEECMLEIQSLYGSTNSTDLSYRTDPGVYWCDSNSFPKDKFNVAERRQGYVVFHFLIMLYMFLALAIICDEYFVPALEEITEKLSLSNDVAGATFMAAGGSAPELFTSLIGVFIADSNVGIGTIVGSAVFNILFVLGMCAFVVGFKKDPQTGKSTILDLTWFPLARDCSFYIIALIALIVFFRSETIEWWESMILIVIYASYVTFMMYNPTVEAKAVAYFKKKDVAPAETELKESEMDQNRWNETANAATGHLHFHTNDPKTVLGIKSDVEVQKTKSDSGIIAAYAVARFSALRRTTMAKSGNFVRPMSVMGTRNELTTTPLPVVTSTEAKVTGTGSLNYFEVDNNEALDGSPFSNMFTLPNPTKKFWSFIVKIIIMPLTIPMILTVPDVRYKKIKNACGGNIYILSFFVSIIWISIFSFTMVWMATRIGETFNVNSALMGLTFLAAGTSVPDLLTSVIVARDGHGDMAVSSSIGSNLFDVTIGLPLPWILWSFMNNMEEKPVKSTGLICSIGLLLAMLLTLVGTIMGSGWRMNKQMGFAMLILYICFVCVSLLLEKNIISCPNF